MYKHTPKLTTTCNRLDKVHQLKMEGDKQARAHFKELQVKYDQINAISISGIDSSSIFKNTSTNPNPNPTSSSLSPSMVKHVIGSEGVRLMVLHNRGSPSSSSLPLSPANDNANGNGYNNGFVNGDIGFTSLGSLSSLMTNTTLVGGSIHGHGSPGKGHIQAQEINVINPLDSPPVAPVDRYVNT